MLSPRRTNAINRPNFGSMWWDNAKTTGYYGAIYVGFGPGLIVGLPFAGFGLTLCSGGAIAGGFAVGIGMVATVLAAPIAALTSIPFTLSAISTRKFRPTQDIEGGIAVIDSVKEPFIQQLIIDQLISRHEKFPFFSVSSLESESLMQCLTRKNTLAIKWQKLIEYLKAKTICGDAYVNNGKKLFNGILESKDFVVDWEKNKGDIPPTINDLNSEGLSPLHLATISGNTGFVKHCIDQKVALNTKTGSQQGGKTALDLAVENERLDTVITLLANNAQSCQPQTLLRRAVLTNNTDIIDAVIANDKTGISDKAILHFAASHNKFAAIKHFVQKHPTLDINAKFEGRTPLEYADKMGHFTLAQKLSDDFKADDSAMTKLREELTIICAVLRDERWNGEAVGFFFKVPNGIDLLRKIPNINIDPMLASREEVYNLATQLQGRNFGESRYRSANTKMFYDFINTLGRNTPLQIANVRNLSKVNQASPALRRSTNRFLT